MSDVSGRSIELLPSAARTATATGVAVAIPLDAKGIGILMITSAFTSGTFTAKLQTSYDGGTTWLDVTTAVTAAVGAVGFSAKYATIPCGPLVRCVNTGATTPVATNQVFVIYT